MKSLSRCLFPLLSCAALLWLVPARAMPMNQIPTQTEIAVLLQRDVTRWRQAIEPDAAETGYLRISWRATFLNAMREAKQQDKPVMLFIMNGHPLACT